MTLETSHNYVDYQGNGVTTSFPYSFRVDDIDDFVLWKLHVASSILTPIGLHEFSATGLGNVTGGTITYPLTGSPLPTGYTLRISREVPIEQNMDIQNQTGFFPEVVEQQLDRMTMMIQQLDAQVNASIGEFDRNVYISISDFEDSDPVDLADIDDADDHTAALNAAWIASCGVPELDANSLPADPGKPIFLPGSPDDVYTFVASELASKFIKVFGQASYRILEDGVFTNQGAIIDDEIPDVTYTIAGSLNYLLRAAETPQYLYSLPRASGNRTRNAIYSAPVPKFDTRWSGSLFIAGDESTTENLEVADRLTVVGSGILPNGKQALYSTLIGGQILSLARGTFHRIVAVGNGALGQAFAIKTRAENAVTDNQGYDHEFTIKSWWQANADLATKAWQYDAAVAGSGIRAYIETAAAAWIAGGHAYVEGNWVEQGARNYYALEPHNSGATFAADLALGYWYDAGPVAVTVYSGDRNDVANITTLGDVGAGRRTTNSDDARGIVAIQRDSLNHVFRAPWANVIGYKAASKATDVENIDVIGMNAFSNLFGSMLEYASIGREIGRYAQNARYGFSGGAYNLEYATTISRTSTIGYGVGRYVSCGPSAADSDASWTAWITGASYTGGIAGQGSYVVVSGVVYRCPPGQTHVAGATFAADLAAGKWIVVADYEQSAIRLLSEHDDATYGKVQRSFAQGYLAAKNTGRLIRSFVSGDNVMEQAWGAVDDIVIGDFALRYSRSTVGKRIIFGKNAYQYLKYGNLFSIFSDTLSRGSITSDLANGGFIFNASPSTNMVTATGPDRITEAGHIWNKASTVELYTFGNTGAFTINGTVANSFTVNFTDAGAAAGPRLDLRRISATPAANDVLMQVRAYGNDSALNDTLYGLWSHVILDPTDTSEDSRWELETTVAGTRAARWYLGAGSYSAGAAGGDKGVNTINVTEYYVAGVKVVGARDTGFAAMTGAADEGTVYAVASVTLPQLAGRVMALQAALTAHGLIGA